MMGEQQRTDHVSPPLLLYSRADNSSAYALHSVLMRISTASPIVVSGAKQPLVIDIRNVDTVM